MTTPRRIEFDKNVLIVVHHELLVVLCHDDCYRSLLLVWNRLALDARLKLASNEVCHERANALLTECLNVALLEEGELEILRDVLNRKRRPFADFEVEVAGVLAKGLGIDGREVDGALVLLGNGSENLDNRVLVIICLCEDVCKRDIGLNP